MKAMMKDAAILLVITVLSGLALGFIYKITKEPIALAEEKATNEAYAEVFADASDFVLQQPELDNTIYLIEWKEAGFESVEIANVLAANDTEGTTLGYVMTIISHEGYGGDITFTMGIRKDGTVNGIAILKITETAGLGMKADVELKPQFANKNVPNFTYTKSGAASESQIDAISGATITTKAITNAVNGGLYFFQTQLGGSSYEAK